MDKVAEDVCDFVQKSLREGTSTHHNQNISTRAIGKQSMLLTARRVTGDRTFVVTVRELTT